MSTTNGTQETKAKTPQDPELKAMSHIKRILDGLAPDARRRVACWIHDLFEVAPAERYFARMKTEVVEALKQREAT